MTHDESAQEATEDRFHVQFDSREVELMTLDELAEAFEAGRIHGNTYVCREGDSEWSTLAEVAGLGEEDEAPAEEVAAAPADARAPPGNAGCWRDPPADAAASSRDGHRAGRALPAAVRAAHRAERPRALAQLCSSDEQPRHEPRPR